MVKISSVPAYTPAQSPFMGARRALKTEGKGKSHFRKFFDASEGEKAVKNSRLPRDGCNTFGIDRQMPKIMIQKRVKSKDSYLTLL